MSTARLLVGTLPTTAQHPEGMPGRPLRPLPRTVAPYQDETLMSYQRRLAAANHLDVYHHLRLHLNEHNASLSNVGDLATLTGQPEMTLLYALPELRENHPRTTELRLAGRTRVFPDHTRQRPACRRCTAADGITGEVICWVRHDQNVCLKHHLWIGPHVIGAREQIHLRQFPDVLKAQTHHRNLIRRHGQATTMTAFLDASDILGIYAQDDPDLGRRRLAILTNEDHAPRPDHPWLPFLIYPEAVALAGLLVGWRHLATSQPDRTASARLSVEVTNRTGLHQRSSRAQRDPLDLWWSAQRPNRRYGKSHQELDSYADTVSLERW